jgi:hypothetical protein
MKSLLRVFPRDTYNTPTGAIKAYRHDLALCEALGQGKSLRIQAYGHRQSDATNARARIRVFETSVPAGRPQETGQEIGPPGTAITTLRPAPIQVNGPFQGRVEIVLEIDDVLNQDNAMEFDLEVHVTVILEE